MKRSLHVGGRGEDVCSPGLLGRCVGYNGPGRYPVGGLHLFLQSYPVNHLSLDHTREVRPGIDYLLGDLVQGTG